MHDEARTHAHGQVLKYATVKGVQILHRKVEYATGMEESIYAATKDAQIKPRVMECALDIRHGAKIQLCCGDGCKNHA